MKHLIHKPPSHQKSLILADIRLAWQLIETTFPRSTRPVESERDVLPSRIRQLHWLISCEERVAQESRDVLTRLLAQNNVSRIAQDCSEHNQSLSQSLTPVNMRRDFNAISAVS